MALLKLAIIATIPQNHMTSATDLSDDRCFHAKDCDILLMQTFATRLYATKPADSNVSINEQITAFGCTRNDDYHDDISAEVAEIRLYTISHVGDLKIDRDKCVNKAQLDFVPTGAYVIMIVSDSSYFKNTYLLLQSLQEVRQKGGLPKKIVIGDIGLEPSEKNALHALVQDTTLEIRDYKAVHESFYSSEHMKWAPGMVGDGLDYDGDIIGGVPYRTKAVITSDTFARLPNDDAEQLIVLDAGGIILDSMHRVRNFVAWQGFYAGTTHTSALSSLISDSGLAPAHTVSEREVLMKSRSALPSCFDYREDFLVDETLFDVTTETAMDVKQLDTFEGGFLAFDRRHEWVQQFIRNFRLAMEDDELWAINQAYYFPHDQKVLTNELWKTLACARNSSKEVHLLDTSNVRFGNVVQLGEDRHKDKFAFKYPEEDTPWSGYSYHYCIHDLDGGDGRHECLDPTLYPDDAWRDYASFPGHKRPPPTLGP